MIKDPQKCKKYEYLKRDLNSQLIRYSNGSEKFVGRMVRIQAISWIAN